MTDTPTAVQVLRNSLDRFLAKDMKGWTVLCDESVVTSAPNVAIAEWSARFDSPRK